MKSATGDFPNNPLNPFIIDAAEHPKIDRVPLISTDAVENFLSEEDGLLGIASEKGVGKSHLLRLKSKRLRDSDTSGALWIPRDELCEKLERTTYSFTKKQARRYADAEIWKALWATAIASTILIKSGIAIPENLCNIFALKSPDSAHGGDPADDDVTIEGCLISLLDNDINEYQTIYPTRLKNLITNRISRRVGVFIDSVDEAFTKHIGQALADVAGKTAGSGRQGAVHESIWINAQLGLVAAARDLNQANRRVNIYFSIRQEALHASRSSLGLQEDSLIQHLHYSKDTVKSIFLSRVELLRSARLSQPNAIDPIEKFLGFGSIQHWSARDFEGRPLLEDSFDFLYRHTLGRIREVLLLGRVILDMPIADRTPDNVRVNVDAASRTLLEQYKYDMIPFWNSGNEAVFRYLESNVISRLQVYNIHGKIKDLPSSPDHPFCYLYARGLLGRVDVPKADVGGVPQISFLQPGTYLLEKNQHILVSPHYFLHPCLESTVRERSANFRLDTRIIVGQSLGCDIPEDSGQFILRWNRQNFFSFIYRDRELHHVSPSGGATYSLIFAVLALAVAESGKCDITIEEMTTTALSMMNAGLIAKSTMRNREPFENVIKNLPSHKEDTGKMYRRDIVEKIKRSLSDMGDSQLAEPEKGANAEDYIKFQNGMFTWAMCDPSQINVVQVLDHLRPRNA